MMKFGINAFLVFLVLVFSACTVPEGEGSVRIPFDPDLYGWKTASWMPFTVSDTISGFAYGKINGTDRYVAVSYTGIIAWSNDGDIWHRATVTVLKDGEPAPVPFSASLNAVAFGDGIFVAVGNGGKAARSTDGIEWTAVDKDYEDGISGFGTENIRGIAWGKGNFIAVGGNSNISCSPDGITWTGCRDADFWGFQLNDIAFDSANGRFYIVGDEGTHGWADVPWADKKWNIRQLPNGDTPPFGRNSIRKVTVGAYGNGIGIGIVYDEWGGRRMDIAAHRDFYDFWGDLDNGYFGDNTINGIAWGGGSFVAAGSGAMIGWWPSDKPTVMAQRYWRAGSFTEFQWWEISALAALKDRFFVGNVGGRIGFSK